MTKTQQMGVNTQTSQRKEGRNDQEVEKPPLANSSAKDRLDQRGGLNKDLPSPSVVPPVNHRENTELDLSPSLLEDASVMAEVEEPLSAKIANGHFGALEGGGGPVEHKSPVSPAEIGHSEGKASGMFDAPDERAEGFFEVAGVGRAGEERHVFVVELPSQVFGHLGEDRPDFVGNVWVVCFSRLVNRVSWRREGGTYFESNHSKSWLSRTVPPPF